MNISPDIMNKIFGFSKNSLYEWRCGNWSLDQTSILCILELSPLEILLLLKYGIKYIKKPKKPAPFKFLKVKYKNGFHRAALAACKIYGQFHSNLYHHINDIIFQLFWFFFPEVSGSFGHMMQFISTWYGSLEKIIYMVL